MIQEYYLEMTEDNRQNALPAQLVYSSNESDVIVGFISEVNHDTNRMRITLFHPTTPNDFMLDGSPSVTMDEIHSRLKESLALNSDMKETWDALIRQSVS